MRRTILLLLLAGSFFSGSAQTLFEGKIIYHNTFESHIPNVTGEQIGKLVGTEQQYFFKGGHYKSVTNGGSIAFQLYDPQTNRLYTKTHQSDTLYWFDAIKNTDEVASFDIIKNKEKILGVDCDALVVTTKAGKTTFYYNAKYKVDIKPFSRHHFGNWYYFLSKSGALPLKTVVEAKQFSMVSVAVEVQPMKLALNYFDVPANTPVKESI